MKKYFSGQVAETFYGPLNILKWKRNFTCGFCNSVIGIYTVTYKILEEKAKHLKKNHYNKELLKRADVDLKFKVHHRHKHLICGEMLKNS